MQIRRLMLAIMIGAVLVAPAPVTQHAASNSFTLEQIKSYPFPNELTASATAHASRGHLMNEARATFGSQKVLTSRRGD